MNRIFLLAFGCVALAAASYGQSAAPATTRTAVFAGGCFWCIQPAYDKAQGGNKTEPDLQARDVRKNKIARIDRNYLRACEDFLRAASRHLLATNRPHPGRRPVHRYWTELSCCDLLWQRRGKENCRGFKRETHALRKI